MAIFNEADEYGDLIIVNQYDNSDSYFFEMWGGSIIDFKPDQALRLVDAIYAREAERFKESM